MPRVSVAQLAAALRSRRGSYTHVASDLGISRETVRRRVLDSPTLRALVLELKTSDAEIVATELKRQAFAGEFAAMRYFLDHNGGDFGYGRHGNDKFDETAFQAYLDRLTDEQLELFTKLARSFPPGDPAGPSDELRAREKRHKRRR